MAAAYDQIGSAGGNAFAFDSAVARSVRGLAAHVSDASWIEMSEETAMRSLDRLLSEADRTWTARGSYEEALGVLNEYDFRLLDAAVGLTQGCLRLLNDRRTEIPPDVAYVISTLGVRAQATCHEVSALLRAGFPNGARGRWRTLHEVAVVSSVLTLGNRYTATRFKHHRWVMLARDLEYADDVAWTDGPSPAAMRRRLAKRYGASYTGTYGWASLVTLRAIGEAKPKWRHLESAARLADGHRHRVKAAHHSVHVDSLGGLDLIDTAGLLHAGARVEGAQPIIWQSIRALADATDSLISLRQRYDGAPVVRACRVYADRMFLELETEAARHTGTS